MNINSRRKRIWQRRKSYRIASVYSVKSVGRKAEIIIPSYLKRAIFWAIVVLIFGYLLLFSSPFEIRDVIIEGDTSVSKEAITKMAPMGQNIFRFSASGLTESILEAFPEVKSADIYRGIPNAIKIIVSERSAAIAWQSGDNRYYLSNQGEVAKRLSATDVIPESVPLVIDKLTLPVETGKSLVSPDFIAFVLNTNKNIYQETGLKPVRYEVLETTFDVNLYTDAGFYIKLNTIRSSHIQLENLKKLMIEKKSEIREYVDLRIDGWAYYK